MLERTKYVCSKCGYEFDRKEACERHESWCIPVYHLKVLVSIEVDGNTKEHISANVHISQGSCSKKDLEKNEDRFNKTPHYYEYDVIDGVAESSTNIEYSLSRTTLRTIDVRKELENMKEKLMTLIKEDIDKQKSDLENFSSKRGFDGSIKYALEELKQDKGTANE